MQPDRTYAPLQDVPVAHAILERSVLGPGPGVYHTHAGPEGLPIIHPDVWDAWVAYLKCHGQQLESFSQDSMEVIKPTKHGPGYVWLDPRPGGVRLRKSETWPVDHQMVLQGRWRTPAYTPGRLDGMRVELKNWHKFSLPMFLLRRIAYKAVPLSTHATRVKLYKFFNANSPDLGWLQRCYRWRYLLPCRKQAMQYSTCLTPQWSRQARNELQHYPEEMEPPRHPLNGCGRWALRYWEHPRLAMSSDLIRQRQEYALGLPFDRWEPSTLLVSMQKAANQSSVKFRESSALQVVLEVYALMLVTDRPQDPEIQKPIARALQGLHPGVIGDPVVRGILRDATAHWGKHCPLVEQLRLFERLQYRLLQKNWRDIGLVVTKNW